MPQYVHSMHAHIDSHYVQGLLNLQGKKHTIS